MGRGRGLPQGQERFTVRSLSLLQCQLTHYDVAGTVAVFYAPSKSSDNCSDSFCDSGIGAILRLDLSRS